jgi:hypothetical protein
MFTLAVTVACLIARVTAVYVSDHWTIADHTVSSIHITISSDATVTQANVAALQVCGCVSL